MADATVCQATSLARGIMECNTLEQIKLITNLAERTKAGMTDEQKQKISQAVIDRSYELAEKLITDACRFSDSF